MTNPVQAKFIHHETTYQMLVDSEEKERGLLEAVVYLLLVIATALRSGSSRHQPVDFADLGVEHIQVAQHIARVLRHTAAGGPNEDSSGARAILPSRGNLERARRSAARHDWAASRSRD